MVQLGVTFTKYNHQREFKHIGGRMFCVKIDTEIVFASSDERRFVNEISKNYAQVSNAKLVKSDGTPIKFSDLKKG